MTTYFYQIDVEYISIKDVERSLSKFYLSDNGFFGVNFWQINEMNLSKLFENAVFLELRKRWFVENENIFYFKSSKFDIDFVLFKRWKVIPLQVCYELNDSNFKREYKQLLSFVEEFNLEKWYMVIFKNNVNIDLQGKIEILRIENLKNLIDLW